jgi:hypothetical protein
MKHAWVICFWEKLHTIDVVASLQNNLILRSANYNTMPWEPIRKFWQHHLQAFVENKWHFELSSRLSKCWYLYPWHQHTNFKFWDFQGHFESPTRAKYKSFEWDKLNLESNLKLPKCWYLYPWNCRYKFHFLGDLSK